MKTRLPIKITIETWIGISIGYVCHGPGSSHIAGNTHADPKANLPYLELVGRLTPQLIAGLVVEKQRGTFGIEHFSSFADDCIQEIIESQLVCERLGYVEQNGQFTRLNRSLPLHNLPHCCAAIAWRKHSRRECLYGAIAATGTPVVVRSFAGTGRHTDMKAFHMRARDILSIGGGAQMSSGIHSAIVSLAVMVSFTFPSFRSGILKNVELRHFSRQRLANRSTTTGSLKILSIGKSAKNKLKLVNV